MSIKSTKPADHAQIPGWDAEILGGGSPICYAPEDWRGAPASFTEHTLEILGQAVMEDWEEPYMRVLAEIATSRGGTILEVGFGMGISARFIQGHEIARHIVIEANRDVAQRAREFAGSAHHPVDVLEGLWEEAVTAIPDGSLDGILFDSYPLTDAELYKNHFPFFPHACRMLRGGGIFTYYSDEERDFSPVHIEHLLSAGFKREQIKGKVVPVIPPPGCTYWKAGRILAPIIRK